jgi:hypothetical protein
VWAQEHLYSAGQKLPITGTFGSLTLAAVERFQAQHALTVDGVIGRHTWLALLHYPPARVRWTKKGARAASATGDSPAMPVPLSATLAARRYEIPPHLGAH